MQQAINDYKATGALNNGSFTAATYRCIQQQLLSDKVLEWEHMQLTIRVDVEPTTGLKVGADYVDFSGTVAATDQEPESGSV